MHENKSRQIIQQYLDQVDAHLQGVPADERAEIIGDLRSHIEEAVGDGSTADEAEVRTVLDRLGNPAAVACEAAGRARAPHAESRPPETRLRKAPGALEIGAIVLTALFWPIGVILTWISERWRGFDKIVATLVPLISSVVVLAVVVGGFVIWGSGSSVSVSEDVQVVPGDPATGVSESPKPEIQPSSNRDDGTRLLIVLVVLSGAFAGPLLTALYLSIRIQPIEEPVDSPPMNATDTRMAPTQAV